MKKILLFTAALLCAASIWADDPVIEGPWTLKDSGTKERAKIANDSIAFNDYSTSSEWWGPVDRVTDANGFGFNWTGTSPANRMRGTFAVFAMQDAVVPPYTSMDVKWTFKLSSKSTKHFSTVCLYALPSSRVSIQNLKVPFTNRFDQIEDKSTIKGLLAWYYNDSYSKNVKSSDTLSATLSFDNSTGSTEQTKEWSMMMTFMVGSADSKSTEGLDESGYFKSLHIDTTWTYFKIFTFDANGGEGEMEQNVLVDDGGNLPTNTYYKSGSSFAGWATSLNGPVVYTDCATITTTAEDKGPQGTLYAVWKEWGHSTKEGPWTQLTVRTDVHPNDGSVPTMSFSQMNNEKWNMGVVQNISGEPGIGYAYSGHSVAQSKMGIFSTYQYEVEVPAYSRLDMKWRFSLYSKTTKHHSTTCLYAAKGTVLSVDTLKVDFSNHYDTQTGKENLLARLTRYDQQGDEGSTAYTAVRNTGFQFHTFTFDNIDGNAPQTQAWYLLLTHVIASAGAKSGLDEWATLKSLVVDTTWTYRKIVTFNANGGAGEMADQIIDNSGYLTPNAFTRTDYIFAGWATVPTGPVVYNDGAKITASATDNGPVTLYAQWVPGTCAKVGLADIWTHVGRTNGTSGKTSNPSVSYNGLNGKKWDGLYSWGLKGDSTGYDFEDDSPDYSKMAIFSIYKHDESVPAYSTLKLAWNFRLGSKSKKHHSSVRLYALPDSEAQIKNLKVDFSDDYVSTTGAEYLMAPPFIHINQDGKTRYSDHACTFVFDNRESSVAQTKTWYMMYVYVLESAGGKSDLDERGYFKHLRADTTWTYSKNIIFDANGGTGTMTKQIIDNSGKLKANLFTRVGYIFAGWATEPTGVKAYDDEELITVTKATKGLVNLYAVWTPNTYDIAYDLGGGEASNPATYTFNETLALNAPTKAGYTFLGWTGSNGSVPQTAVSIAKGSTGNKSYTAHWMSNAVGTTQDLIAAIGEVTTESGETIAQARAAYDALSEEDQALVSNYATLTAAEAAYEALAGNTTIQFMDQDESSIAEAKIQLDYPEAPKISGYTFQYWRVAEKNLSDGIIRLQAVYTSTPTDIEETPFPSGEGRGEASKFIKEGNVYILKDEFIYTINGQRVNF